MSADLVQAVVLGIVQGVTEFLPVSSSAHLVLLPQLLGWPTPPLTFDVTVHWATAAAVLLFFRGDWASLARGALRWRPGGADGNARLSAWIVLATIPAALAGLLLEPAFEAVLESDPRFAARASAALLLVTAVVLVLAEVAARRGGHGRDAQDVGLRGALAVGLAQAVAILPGISRSGATIAAGMASGLKRQEAARFSFLLSAPIIFGAGVLQLGDLLVARPTAAEAAALVAGFVAALAVSYVAIGWLLAYIRRSPLYPFAAYCAALGLVGLWLLR